MGFKKICCDGEAEADIEKTVMDSDYKVEEKYKIAEYKAEIVAEVMTKNRISAQKLLFNVKNFKLNIFGQTWVHLVVYLICYYIVQIIFQTGRKNPICLTSGNYSQSPEYRMAVHDQAISAWEYRHAKEESKTWIPPPPPMPNITEYFVTPEELCQLQSLMKFQLWGRYEALMTRYLTFLLGFYVGYLIRRWWSQVSKIPDTDQVTGALGGLVWPEPDDKSSSEAALDLKKTIVRYCLLSWTMCLTSVSCPLRKQFDTVEAYIKKKLITEEEHRMIKVGGGSEQGWIDQWWTPLTWATHLTNDAFNRTKLIPKDHKDLRAVLGKMQDHLDDICKFTHTPLPEVYKQAVYVAILGWMFMGVLGGQGSTIYDPRGITGPSSLGLTLLYNFPFHMLLKYLLIIGWLRTAEIVGNPFDGDDYYDVDLEKLLDFNIWKASVTLQNQKMVSRHAPRREAKGIRTPPVRVK